MMPFFASLALVALAQIPFLLKLWLDYRSKTISFRQELHRRQLEVFPPLAAQLNSLHSSIAMIATTFGDVSSWGNDETKKFAREFAGSAGKENLRLAELYRGAELILPASVAIALHEYIRDAARLSGEVLGVDVKRFDSNFDRSHCWQQQQRRFDIAVNIMRLASAPTA